MNAWDLVLVEARDRIKDPARRVQLAALLSRAAELTLAKEVGSPVDADLQVVAASAASLVSAEIATTAQALEDAALSVVRKIIWTGLFGLPVPA